MSAPAGARVGAGRAARAAPAEPPCPCGRGAPRVVAYADCCGRWHAGPLRLAAPDAEHLMRSRYTAYVLGLEAYLLDTWHPDTRPPALGLDAPGMPPTTWLGLEVRAHRPGPDGRASVEFVARSRSGGRGHRLHELGRFVQVAGRWLYLDGEMR